MGCVILLIKHKIAEDGCHVHVIFKNNKTKSLLRSRLFVLPPEDVDVRKTNVFMPMS
jgi:hypothetical protein